MDSKYLSQYPFLEDAIKQNIEVKNILAKNKQLIVKYDIIYNSQGSELQIQNEITVMILQKMFQLVFKSK